MSTWRPLAPPAYWQRRLPGWLHGPARWVFWLAVAAGLGLATLAVVYFLKAQRFEIDSLLAPGTNDLMLTAWVEDDCLSLVHAVVNLPAGSSPVPPPSRVPDRGSSLILPALSAALLRALFGKPKAA